MNYWIWLASIKKIGPIRKKKLLNYFISPETIFNSTKENLIKVDGISEESANFILESKDVNLVNNYETYIKKNNIKIININDLEYPQKLKQIYDAPITLFCIGNVDLLNKTSIGIIGSREPSLYGTIIARKFSKELSKEGIVIISGLAKGIDTYAHLGSLDVKGETIAVLGNGIDIAYPKQNTEIYNEIARKGLIISEYIVGTKPEANNFPVRNRIISGLSKGIIVVEAKKKSGTMITTDYALDQGREVYVIPGNINSPNSEGTNNLIKEGAKPITSVEDILYDLR